MNPREKKLRLRKSTVLNLSPGMAAQVKGGTVELETKDPTEGVDCTNTEICTYDEVCTNYATGKAGSCLHSVCYGNSCYTQCATFQGATCSPNVSCAGGWTCDTCTCTCLCVTQQNCG